MSATHHAARVLTGKAMLAACLPIVCLTSFAALAANDEAIFEQAPAYTVQIRTVVYMPFAEDERSASMGAGFVVDAARGWVMTNAHVAARSPSDIRIRFRGGDYHDAEKLYVDPYLDLAILQLGEAQRTGLEAARLDCGELPPVGHPVGAFGHPWGLAYTGTRGIVSGVTAQLEGELLQIDAPINGGNSGGPLLSLQSGAVVGISTASINEDDDQNTNFAVPMKYACRVLHLLQVGEDPSPPQLSTVFFENLDGHGGLVVATTYLAEHTLALEAGDTVTGVVGAPGPIRNEGQLVHALRGRLDRVALELTRSGEPMVVEGRLPPAQNVIERRGVYVAGLLIAPTGFHDSQELNLDKPLMVHSVDWGSLGESLEIEKWDMLVKVDGQHVNGLADLIARLQEARERERSVVFSFKRWSYRKYRVYDHIERELTVDDLEFVGSRPPEHVSSNPDRPTGASTTSTSPATETERGRRS